MSDISVVVVAFNGSPWIRRCLASLAKRAEPPHVIVVDNASTDDTTEIVSREFPTVDLVRSETNDGFGRGNNIGIRRALDRGSAFVFLLNQDAYVLDQTIDELRQFLLDHAEFGAVSPLHCSPSAERIDLITMRGYLQTFAPEFLADACMGRVQPFYKTFGVNAALWFVRREVFLQVGGFDPIFFMYGEDDDLLHRMAYHKIGFALLPSSRAVHLRESPAPARVSWWGDVKRRAGRRRAALLAQIKRPNSSLPYMALVLIGRGWITPLSDLLVKRDVSEFAASWIAACRMLLELRRVVRHARLSAQAGPHFL